MKVYAAGISRLADIADYLTLSYSPGFDTIYAGTSTSAYGIVAADDLICPGKSV